jgi:hypothetical protein
MRDSLRRSGRIVLCALAAAGVGSTAAEARAAEPNAAECLMASDASLRSGTDHRLRAERAQLLVCAAVTCPAEIRKECTRRVDEVNAALPTVVFEVKDPAGNDVGAVRVSMDGEVLTDHLDGMALSVDPGMHAFVFETAGQAPMQRQLVIREGQKDRHESIVFGPKDQPPASPQPMPRQSLSRGPSRPDDDSGSGVRTGFVIATAVIGVAGITTGTVFGLQALSKRDDAQRVCPATCADPTGVALWRDAKSAGNVSTVAFVAGGVAAAAAAAIWLSAPARRREAPGMEVGVGPSGVTVRGRW